MFKDPSSDGWVKLWRKTQRSEVFSDPVIFKLWCLCLMKANHKIEYISIKGIARPIKLNPGQFITGRFSLHEDYHQGKKRKKHISPLTLWRKLKILENMQNLNIESRSVCSIITISNWEQYQQGEQRVNNGRTTGEQRVNTNKNEKNNKNDKNIKTLYEKYVQKINPARKSRQRSERNLRTHLKKHSFENLSAAIDNYASAVEDTLPKFKKDPANFFGVNEQPFLDYLPENFEPPRLVDIGRGRQPPIEELEA